MFEIVCVLVLPVMLIIYYLIQRVVVHHTSMETQLMIHDLVVEAMNKHDHDFGCHDRRGVLKRPNLTKEGVQAVKNGVVIGLNCTGSVFIGG